MEIPVIEQLNLHGTPSEIDNWMERFELWCSIQKEGKEKQSALFLILGGPGLYSLMKNLAFPQVPAQLQFRKLKSLLLDYIFPVNFQVTERVQLNSPVREQSMSCHDSSLPFEKKSLKYNDGDRVEEKSCGSSIKRINDTSIRGQTLKEKNLHFSETLKSCDQYTDIIPVTFLQFRKPNDPNSASEHASECPVDAGNGNEFKNYHGGLKPEKNTDDVPEDKLQKQESRSEENQPPSTTSSSPSSKVIQMDEILLREESCDDCTDGVNENRFTPRHTWKTAHQESGPPANPVKFRSSQYDWLIRPVTVGRT